MSSFKPIVITLLFIAFNSMIVSAQDDTEGCKDHPLFNRMPNHYLSSCEQLEFSLMHFPVGQPDANNENKIREEPVEGKVMVFQYYLKDDATPPSGLQIMRNFQNAAKQNGGVILGEYQGWCKGYYTYDGDINNGYLPVGNGCTNWGTTIKFTKDREFWVYVQQSDGGYDMVIVEKEAMRQDIQASELFETLNREGAVTLYINFETGKDEILPECHSMVAEIYNMLIANPELNIMIEGHTDNVGDKAFNQMLSEKRAASVKKALVNKGIAEGRIRTAGFGQDKPISDNSTEEGRARNRRVEIKRQM